MDQLSEDIDEPMIRLLGSDKRLCDGLSRRDLLHIGGLGALGLTLGEASRLQAANTASSTASATFGRAKSCILLFLFGSPPQHETFDPKPDAPDGVRGELGAISSRVPGAAVCELLPKTAAMLDRMTVVRSMTHPYPVHGVAYALTGMPTYTPAIEARPRDKAHWPFVGSVVDYVERRRHAGRRAGVPRNIALPWLFGSKSDLSPLAGPYAAFLGSGYDPVWTDFEGDGTRVVPSLNDKQTAEVRDPFAGVKPDGRFRLSAATRQPGLTHRRFELRRALLDQFDASRNWLTSHGGIGSWDRHQQAAWSLLTADRIRQALDVQREPDSLRQRYGMTLFGQSCLAARRLVEAGSRFVSVFWDPWGPYGGSCWDTHANHFPRLKEYLLPVFDQTYASLLADLDERGLLDETLVLCLSEHGRTPKIDSKPRGAGRHHWSRAYSAALAGGGTARGRIVGSTDSIGGDVASTPISPKDILASTLHLLGIDPHLTVPDAFGQPRPVAGDGRVRDELF